MTNSKHNFNGLCKTDTTTGSLFENVPIRSTCLISNNTSNRWIITGATGQLASHVIDQLSQRNDESAILSISRRENVGIPRIESVCCDLTQADRIQRCVEEFRPTHVLHLGGMTSVADAHRDHELAHRVNVEATDVLCQAASSIGARFVFTSTDMVFDGRSAPYNEESETCPLSEYGRTKARAEDCVLRNRDSAVVRLPLMYGFPRSRRTTTFSNQVAALRSGQPLRLFDDEFRTPVWLADAAVAIVSLAESDFSGIVHVAGPERLSRFDMGKQMAELMGIDAPNIDRVSRFSVDASEPRPEDLSLDGSKFASVFPNFIPGPMRAEVFDDAVD